MITILRHLLDEARLIPTIGDRHLAAIGLLRIALQHCCIAMAEWLVAHGGLVSQSAARDYLPQLRSPTDGTLVDGLAEMLVGADNAKWSGVSAPIWTRIDPKRRAATLGGSTLHEILCRAVLSRNDGAEGHGILGDEDPDAIIDLITLLIEHLPACFPRCLDASGKLVISSPDGRTVSLELLRVYDGDLVCYRRIKQLNSGRCRVEAQRQTSLQTKEEVAWDAKDVLRYVESSGDSIYDFWTVGDGNWKPLVLLPERLTNSFRGRDHQLRDLLGWMNDLDSLACMVYGDGGIGKTTLILEFLHRVLDGDIQSEWKPSLITYFTAKRTQWGVHGLEIIKFSTGGIVDLCKHIVSSWEGKPLSKDWLRNEPEQLIDKLGGYLKEQLGINRKEHLIVLDNTETLASSDDEVKALAGNIRRLTRRAGRVLLTSRRREPIEAHGIELLPLTEDECIQILRDRGLSSNLQSISTASERTLRKFSNELGRRPLVIEVFLQVLSEPGIGLQQAFDRVQRMQRQDLGEFLYTDAWRRLSLQMQYVILLMTKVADVLDEPLVKLCCIETNVSVMDAYEALRGSRGIATLPVIAGQTQVVFHPDFLKFCSERTLIVEGQDVPHKFTIDKVRRRYEEFLLARSKKITDRVDSAFRKPFARLAYQAGQEGNLDECETYYELAVVEDSDNALLFDRYANFLFRWRHRVEDAYGKAVRATELGAGHAETWFTRGMIEAKLFKTTQAISSLHRSMELGKEPYLVWLQIAYAYTMAKPPDYTKALKALESSHEYTPTTGDFRLAKHNQELAALSERVRKNLSVL